MEKKNKLKRNNGIGVLLLAGFLFPGLIAGNWGCQKANNSARSDQALMAAVAAGLHPTLGLSARSSSAAGAVDANGITMTDANGNTLIISDVRIVLSQVELKNENSGLGCDDPASTEKDCEELEIGPIMIDLPLDGTVATEFAVPVSPGTFDQVEYEIHRATADDHEIVTARPQLTDHSIYVSGTYNGISFEYVSNLEIKQEKQLNPPLEIAAGVTSVNLTLDVNLDGWFVDGGGILLDPATANPGGLNETTINNNILNSMATYEDDNFDGIDDHTP